MNGLILEAVGWGLVHLVWQGAFVAVALALALRWVGRRSANLRYALACGALGIMLALPVATAWRHASRATELRPARTAVVPRPVAPMPVPVSAAVARLPASRPLPVKEAARLPRLDELFQQVGEHLPWLVLAWGLGVATSSLRLLKGWMGLRRQVDEAVHASWEWQRRLEVLARRMNLTRPVRLLVSSKLDVPSTLGWLKPVVLVPTATLTGLAVRELELVLAHELAHIHRHDFAVNVVQTLVETLLFYHPAVWWMSQVIRVERENCCDDLAVRQGPGALPYARALTALEALRLQGMDASGPAMSALGGSLKDRVRRLVVTPASRCSSRWAAGVSIVTLASSLALAVPLTALAVQHPAKVPESKALASPAASAAVAPAPLAVPQPMPLPVLAAPPAPPPAPAPVIAPVPTPGPSSKEAARAARKASDDADEKTRVGVDPLSVDQLVALKIAGVTPEVVERISAMGYEPTVNTLVGFQHAGVTPDYVKSMTDRFGRSISAEQLMALKHLGVTPEWLKQMAALGFDTVDSDDLLSAKALGINAAWLNELKAAGFGKLSLDEAVQLRALGVDASYLRELEGAGVKPTTVDELVRLRTGGVDADFIRRMQKPRK
ncbi:M56 family metallopeptidase [Corallococcus sp. AS-1-12]|uniref:M56 family metallopeptidase n=1 Tax=Corallococcus sp. AS-1-12 TaxID=2874598 RepID=UPI001CBBF4B5|nr:M56 family metallopeptidase [Corallococcus sp. AS-1-12]MBZ4334890.1 M48 family metalloprotease [Corallococcus sp. AS-1-12]